MASTKLYYLNQFITTTLSVVGGIDDSQTTGIVLQSTTGIDTSKPGIALINYSDPLNTAIAEWVTYTSISTGELQGVTRGAEGYSAKSHSNGVTIAFPISESHVNNLASMFDTTGLDIAQISTPASPDSGRNKVYFKSDGDLYKLTSGGTESAVSLVSTSKYLQQGVLINGTLSVSVASNNLTVALKGMDGTDPSSTNPVYVRIGDTVRSCTAALSVTKNAGTNWFNSGAAQHATYSNDYFVYLIWNTTPATDIMDIGFARVPYGKTYADFSGTSTAETYLATANASAPTSSDELQVIGRFSAILSATASFNWSAVTDIIVRPIYRTKWTKYNPTITWTAGLAPSTVSYQESKFIFNEDMCMLDLGYVYGSAGTTVTKVSVPVPIAKNNALWSGYDIQPGGMSNAFAPVATMSQWTTSEAFAMWCSSATIDRFGVTTFYQIK